MSATSLLSAAGSRPVLRTAYGVAAKVVRGFQVFRIDGYSLTKNLPGGVCIPSQAFPVGGRTWDLQYYPNGADVSKDSDSISLHLRLRLHPYHQSVESVRVRAQYRFSLLDHAGNAAYELPADTGVFQFKCPGRKMHQEPFNEAEYPTCGYAEFIRREELERRRESLLKDDRLAIRCDVALIELEALDVAPKENHNHHNRHDYSDDDSDWEGTRETSRRRRQPLLDDGEYVRRCLSNKSRRG